MRVTRAVQVVFYSLVKKQDICFGVALAFGFGALEVGGSTKDNASYKLQGHHKVDACKI